MRRFTLAAGVACAVLLNSHAGAQLNTTTSGGGSTMPGQSISTYRGGPLTPIGKQLPAAAPSVGQSISSNPLMRPYDPNRPYDNLKGTNINPNQLVAPLTGPDGKPVQPPDTLDKLSAQIKAFFIRTPQESLPRPPYVPGIGRRNRERAQMLWRRD